MWSDWSAGNCSSAFSPQTDRGCREAGQRGSQPTEDRDHVVTSLRQNCTHRQCDENQNGYENPASYTHKLGAGVPGHLAATLS
jgi:hypothetical protein